MPLGGGVLVKERGYVRKKVTELQKSVAASSSCVAPNFVWTDEVELQVSQCEAKAQRLSEQLKYFNKKVYEELRECGDDAQTAEEYDNCFEYDATIDEIRIRLQTFRKKYAPIGRPAAETAEAESGGASDVKVMKEAIQKLVELQTRSMQREEQRVGGDDERLNNSGNEANSTVTAVLQEFLEFQKNTATGAVRLPTAQLKRFGGNHQEFMVFMDEFARLVHEKADLSRLQKHKVLRDLLYGQASRALDGIPLTEQNYEVALRCLKKRFGSMETIVFDIFTKMLEMQKIHNANDVKQLRDLVDRVNNYIITLDAIKLDKKFYCCIMYPILLRAIPESLSMKFLATTVEADECNNNANDNEGDSDQLLVLEVGAHEDLPKLFSSRFDLLVAFLARELTTRERQRALCPRSGGNHLPKGAPGQRQQREVSSGGQSWQQRPTAATNVYASFNSAHGDSRSNVSSGAQGSGVRDKQQDIRRQVKPSQDNQTKDKCVFCEGGHAAAACTAKLSAEERKRTLTGLKLCWVCFGAGHWAINCSGKPCGVCRKPHSELLCTKVRSTKAAVAAADKGLLQTGHVQVCRHDDVPKMVRFMLDTGSQKSFITEDLAKSLNVDIVAHEWTYFHVFGGLEAPTPRKLPVAIVKVLTKSGESFQVKTYVVPKIVAGPPPVVSRNLRSQLRKFTLAEIEGGPLEVTLLFGAADSYRVTTGRRARHGDDVFVVETLFGDVVVSDADGPATGSIAAVTTQDFERFWSLESLGVKPEELEKSSDLVEVAESFKKSIERMPTGRYQVMMNLKLNVDQLDSNEAMASKQLTNLALRLKKDPQLKADYTREIRAFFEGGFAEPLPKGETARYVFPHFPVINPDKESFKVRPVFNASAAMKGKLSLNDCIQDTPNLLPGPLESLLNFRRYAVAVTGDIGKAYLMVGIHPSQRNLLCFFWFDDEQNLTGKRLFRMTATSFGVKDSQFNTITVIREHARKYLDKYPDAATKLTCDLYMDDILSGADTEEAAYKLWKEMTFILADAGMFVKKFKSSSERMRKQFGETPIDEEVLLKPCGLVKVLGVSWDQENDVFTFAPKDMIHFVKNAKPTMRTVMGACARLYDPQGLIAPFTMLLKLVLQEAHQTKCRLDEELPTPLSRRWFNWGEELKHLQDFKIPRQLKIKGEASVELHAFADASERAFAAVVYLKAKCLNGEVNVSLVAAKAKLAPLKQVESLTIPKKELMAATLATRLVVKVREYLRLPDCKAFFWGDSEVTLHWIHSGCPDKWGIFVRNRLREILTTTKADQWGHCPGKFNPADMPSRGMTMKKLNEANNWIEGPDFIRGDRTSYPLFKVKNEGQTVEEHVLNVVTKEPICDLEKFSSLARLVRVTAYVQRACRRFVEKTVKNGAQTTGPLTGSELMEAKQLLLREAQRRCFGGAIDIVARNESLEGYDIATFQPFVDAEGMLRVGGRLQFSDEVFAVRHPILLKDDPLVRLIIRDAHEGRVHHMKVEAVMNELRQNYWVIRMRQLVKSVLHKCAVCARDRARLVDVDEAPLPQSRVEMSFRAFKTVGLDYMGPLMVRTEEGEKKVWVALFTCAVVRAIHLEVVESLTTAACLAAIRRFVAARGCPSRIISDNALAFKKASNCLKALFKALNSEQIQNYFGQVEITWQFNVPLSPWWGGMFERMIRVVKTCLRKALKGHKVALMNFITLLQEIAAIVNQRPLTKIPSETNEPVALSPMHFIAPQLPLLLPAGQLISLGEKPDGLVKIWQQRERVLNAFWRRWRNEYLLVLRTALRRRGGKENELVPGDVVIVKDGTPRAFWKLAKIEKPLPGKDGVARAYTIHLGGGKYVDRPSKLLAKLL